MVLAQFVKTHFMGMVHLHLHHRRRRFLLRSTNFFYLSLLIKTLSLLSFSLSKSFYSAFPLLLKVRRITYFLTVLLAFFSVTVNFKILLCYNKTLCVQGSFHWSMTGIGSALKRQVHSSLYLTTSIFDSFLF